MPAHFRAVDNAVEKVKKVKEYVENGLGVTLDVALDLEEVCKESERVRELEDTMLQYVGMEREMDQWVKAVDLAKTEFNRQYNASSDNIPNIEEIFKQQLNSLEAGNSDTTWTVTRRSKNLGKRFGIFIIKGNRCQMLTHRREEGMKILLCHR
ncbi:E3 SUMO-protein ligase NSE2 [Desmophyllum pertusum]|uniref:E3 SUMO-protein ligase NSE2 n=1 Tax=Desmophyllum pertusum TaxID=174260 RepID=A0A9W9Y8V7_9CNID|nr:E3 SUMO-protein ligase NSE2 [Desmophyllum pertusum]